MSKTIRISSGQIIDGKQRQLELYEKLADHRLIFINYLLEEIMDLTDFEATEEFIDYIKYQAKYYGNEDAKIVEEIEKTKGI